jgi:uncharacterized membrane protein
MAQENWFNRSKESLEEEAKICREAAEKTTAIINADRKARAAALGITFREMLDYEKVETALHRMKVRERLAAKQG